MNRWLEGYGDRQTGAERTGRRESEQRVTASCIDESMRAMQSFPDRVSRQVHLYTQPTTREVKGERTGDIVTGRCCHEVVVSCVSVMAVVVHEMTSDGGHSRRGQAAK